MTTTHQDPHSFARPQQVRVTHLDWTANVDFASRTIKATAAWTLASHNGSAPLVLDTRGLHIHKVWLNDSEGTTYKLADFHPLMGQALVIDVNADTAKVCIEYTTSPEAEALQWLTPQQTFGKEHPFLFTQSQAILARSWIPCQDSPGVRFTYDAEVTVPTGLLALMSASNPQRIDENGCYCFEMKQPIVSYLLALAVGDIAFQKISGRTGVYAEPGMIDQAVWEFADLEKMVSATETLYGPYPWHRYDVIVLPPSFPFGGMENPRLTFATPTIIAGDRSLTSLIAHELAHSWSGNLVTNATWNDFWLNEGFTVYVETRIMEKLYGKQYAEMLASLNMQDLLATIAELEADGKSADTKLKLKLDGRNPDEGVTDIAYNKGYFFLRTFEEDYGRDKFDKFLQAYFDAHQFRSINTETFVQFISGFYQANYGIQLPTQLFNEWIFTEGLPARHPKPVSSNFADVEEVLMRWRISGTLTRADAADWSTHEWLHFIRNLPESLTPQQLREIDTVGGFSHTGNAEIIAAWALVAIANKYTDFYPRIESFLVHTGRRKFLMSLYQQMTKTREG
ncbi:MAG: M1 family metallopeptidase, partial [Bacteroidia bacterium]|nr:M1 family metallopeptidase [Bacteroidia bacterium]